MLQLFTLLHAFKVVEQLKDAVYLKNTHFGD